MAQIEKKEKNEMSVDWKLKLFDKVPLDIISKLSDGKELEAIPINVDVNFAPSGGKLNATCSNGCAFYNHSKEDKCNMKWSTLDIPSKKCPGVGDYWIWRKNICDNTIELKTKENQ